LALFEVARAAGAGIDDQKNPGISSICKADFPSKSRMQPHTRFLAPKSTDLQSPTLRVVYISILEGIG
jgi:hypothetical protein